MCTWDEGQDHHGGQPQGRGGQQTRGGRGKKSIPQKGSARQKLDPGEEPAG